MSQENRRIKLQFRQYRFDSNFPIFSFSQGNWPSDNFLKKNMDYATHRYVHFHNCLEIGYCYRGSERLNINDEEHDIFSGDMMMVLPYTPHSTEKFSSAGTTDGATDTYCEYLYIDPFQLLAKTPNHLMLERDYPNAPRVFTLKAHPEVVTLVVEILNELRTKPKNYKDCVKGLALALLMRIARTMPTDNQSASPDSRQIYTVFPAIEYLNNSYTGPVKVDQLHQRCYISATHFRRMFQSVMGCSPLEYLHQLRINKACDLLYATSDSILNVALAVGFDSISSFNRQFIKLIGVPPSDWRKKRISDQQDPVSVFAYDIQKTAE